MADFSMVGGGPSAFDDNFVIANTGGTLVTSDSTVDTKGAYVELVSAVNNTQASRYLKIQFSGRVNLADFLVDIAIGPPTEQVIIENIWVLTSTAGESAAFELEYEIPAGVRISASCQSNVSSAAIKVLISRAGGAFSQSSGLNRITTAGADTGNTSGIQVATDASAQTFGAWVPITASLANQAKGFIVAAHKDGVASWTTLEVAYQVGVGGTGVEEVIAPTKIISVNSNENMHPAIGSFIPVGIASGEQVSIRASGETNNGDLDLHYVMYFID